MDFDLVKAKKLLEYDPASGDFKWLKARGGAKIGAVAGSLSWQGYRIIKMCGCSIRAHRLAWFYCYGVFPSGDIDHINGITFDNRMENLRDVTRAINMQNQRTAQVNNKSGYLGVSWHEKRGKWRAQICLNRKVRTIGFFEDPTTAHEAYVLKKREIHEGCVI